MRKYNYHSLALNDKEESEFKEVSNRTGFGVKKIFMAMLNTLSKDNPVDMVGGQPKVEEE